MTSRATKIAAFSIFVGVVTLLACVGLTMDVWSNARPRLSAFQLARNYLPGVLALGLGIWTAWSQSERAIWWTLLLLFGQFFGLAVYFRNWWLIGITLALAALFWRTPMNAVEEIRRESARRPPSLREPTPFD